MSRGQNDERVAFVQLLESRITSGADWWPELADDQLAQLGQYGDAYKVVVGYQDDARQRIDEPLTEVVGKFSVKLDDRLQRQQELREAYASLKLLPTAINEEEGKADRSRVNLRLAPEVKVVFDRAYARGVTQLAEKQRAVVNLITDGCDAALKQIELVESNRAGISAEASPEESWGDRLVFADPNIQAEFDKLHMTFGGKFNEAVMAAPGSF